MQLVIADTGPVNYLLLIGHIDILPALFHKVILPSAVLSELTDPRTPLLVRNWAGDPPSWVDVRRPVEPVIAAPWAELGAGETAALTLATELHADLVLMDDKRAVAAAFEMGITVTGTLGILARAGRLGLIDLADAFRRLKGTNFRYRQETMDRFLNGLS